MALFTSKGWLVETEPIVEPGLSPATPLLTTVSVGCVWVQLILGAAFRHTGIRLLPHLIGACVVTVVLCWTVVRILTRYTRAAQLRRPAELILGMLIAQLGLGFAAYVTRLIWMLNPSQTFIWIVISTVAHVTGGAVVLAATAILAIQARRMIRAGASEVLERSVPRKAVTA
jgi:hypothetical protein